MKLCLVQVLFFTAVAAAHAQVLTLSNPTPLRHVTRNSHKRVVANFSLTYTADPSGAAVVDAIQFTLLPYTPANLTSFTATAGSGSTAAGKQVQCTAPSPLGVVVCVVYGLNVNMIGTGDVVDFSAVFLPSTGLKQARFVLSGVVAADENGNGAVILGSSVGF